MAIEFRCIQCKKLLKVPDAAAGKKVKCPGCTTVLRIPAAVAAPPPPRVERSPEVLVPLPPRPKHTPQNASDDLIPLSDDLIPLSDDLIAMSAMGRSLEREPAIASPGRPENPFAAPASTSEPTGSETRQPIMAGTTELWPTQIEFADIFQRTWAIFSQQWRVCLASVFLSLIAAILGFGVLFFGPIIAGFSSNMPALGLLGGAGGYLLGVAFVMWVLVGTLRTQLAVARGDPANLADLFSFGPEGLTMFAAAMVITAINVAVLLVAGLPLAMIARIVATSADQLETALGLPLLAFLLVSNVLTSYAYLLIVDCKVNAIEAIRLSFEITRGNCLTLCLIWVVGIVIVLGLSGCVLGLGVFLTVPFAAMLYAVTYLVMIGEETDRC